MTTTLTPFAQAIVDLGLRMKATEDWNDDAPAWAIASRTHHYRIDLERKTEEGTRGMRFWFYTGILAGEPTIESVVECLVSDSYIASLDFDDFIAEFGIEIKSIKDFNEQVKGHKLTQDLNERFMSMLNSEPAFMLLEGKLNA